MINFLCLTATVSNLVVKQGPFLVLNNHWLFLFAEMTKQTYIESSGKREARSSKRTGDRNCLRLRTLLTTHWLSSVFQSNWKPATRCKQLQRSNDTPEMFSNLKSWNQLYLTHKDVSVNVIYYASAQSIVDSSTSGKWNQTRSYNEIHCSTAAHISLLVRRSETLQYNDIGCILRRRAWSLDILLAGRLATGTQSNK